MEMERQGEREVKSPLRLGHLLDGCGIGMMLRFLAQVTMLPEHGHEPEEAVWRGHVGRPGPARLTLCMHIPKKHLTKGRLCRKKTTKH